MASQASPVKKLALSHGLSVLQPPTLRDPEVQSLLREAQAEVMVVAAYGLILPQAVLDLPRRGCLNIHASLLPRWRGAAPIQRALLAGDGETGVCIMQMEAGLDTGPVLARATTSIEAGDTAGSLHDRLASMGAALLLRTLANWPAEAIPQPDAGVTYAAKVEKREAAVDWRRSADELHAQIRAFNPFPGAHALFLGKPLKIWTARPVPGEGVPGTVLTAGRDGIVVACGRGALCVTELQQAGGKRLPVGQFLAGHPLTAGDLFESATG